jgi:hypothetical protein
MLKRINSLRKMTNLLHISVPCASQLQILSLKFFVDKLSKAWSKSMPNLQIHHWNKNFLTYLNCNVFINGMVCMLINMFACVV